MEITKEIFQVGGGGLTSFEDVAVYLIHFGNGGAVVDAGSGWAMDKLFGNIQECGVAPAQIQYLLITHCDYDHTDGHPYSRTLTWVCRLCHTIRRAKSAVWSRCSWPA